MPLLVCPNCHVEMKKVNKESVEIDICTNCQGIWLDKGELEKLLSIAKTHFDYEIKHGKEKKKRSKFWVNIFDVFNQ